MLENIYSVCFVLMYKFFMFSLVCFALDVAIDVAIGVVFTLLHKKVADFKLGRMYNKIMKKALKVSAGLGALIFLIGAIVFLIDKILK